MIGARKVGDWRNVITEMRALSTTTRSVAIKRAVAQEARYWAKEIKSGLRTQRTAKMAKPPWAPLKDATKKRKKRTKTLIDTGTMLRSIGVDRIGPFAYFVGVKRGAKSADGEDLVNIAAVHEYGTARAGPTGTTVIPPRQFIKPWEDELKKELNDRLYERYWDQVKRSLTRQFVKKGKLP